MLAEGVARRVTIAGQQQLRVIQDRLDQAAAHVVGARRHQSRQRRGLNRPADQQSLAGLQIQAHLNDQFRVLVQGTFKFRGHSKHSSVGLKSGDTMLRESKS